MPASPLASGLRANTAPVEARISLTLAVSLVTSTLVACGALGSSPARTTQNQSLQGQSHQVRSQQGQSRQGQSQQDQLQPVSISLSPGTGMLVAGSRQQFTATVTNSSDSAVIWSASMGQVSRDGLYVAPEVTSETEIVVTARSANSGHSIATATLQITPRPAGPRSSPVIMAENLPAGTAGTGYSSRLGTNDRTSNDQGRSSSGSSQSSSPQSSSPQRMSLDAARGPNAGTSSANRTATSAAAVSDANSRGISASLSSSVTSPAVIPSGTYDGPAELPRAYVQSAVAYTPAPGAVTHVAAGGDLQAALNNAKCGDTIELQAGATYTGVFTFPAKNCDDNHWIVVRTSALDSQLPPEGTRITPCYAGVSSLPGRPDFHCAATANVMSRLVIDARQGSGPIQFASRANHYRLLGLEVTRRERGSVIYSLASIDPGGIADHIVYDRLWMHGTAQEETERGVQLGGSTYVAVVDSFFTDFHCIAKTGACGDSQAISGGTGDHPMGPYQIVNNFLEAGAESVIFGGGSATQTPADIEIRRNHMFKPLTWKRGNAGYVGGADGNPFIVKNLFELKNAQRVQFEGNILEDSWGGFSQTGFGILLTPKNQAIGNDNVCPICQVTDVTIRYVTISHVGSGLQIGDGLSDNGGAALAGKRYSIHDVVVDDIDPTRFLGNGNFAQVSMGVNAPVLQSVAIDHVTAFPPNVMFNVGDNTKVNPQMNAFTFTNSIINAGSAPMRSTGGGPANCAYFDSPLITLNACFASYSFRSNVIIASPDKFFGAWPSGNMFPGNVTAIHFVNYQNGNGGDYHLDPSSPYKNAATDGKDLGADMEAVATATANVE